MNQAAAAVVVVGVRAKYVNLRIHQKTIYNKLRRMEGGSVRACVRACKDVEGGRVDGVVCVDTRLGKYQQSYCVLVH